MSSPCGLGIALGNSEVLLAVQRGHDAAPQRSMRIAPLPGDDVIVVPDPSPLLPVRFAGARSLADGRVDWLSRFLPQLRRVLVHEIGEEPQATCLTVPSDMDDHSRERLRQMACDLLWGNVLIVSHAEALGADVLRQGQDGTLLVCAAHFDGVDVCLLQASQRRLAVIDQVQLGCLSQSLIDEILVAMYSSEAVLSAQRHIDWRGRWSDARRMRDELEYTSIAAAQLSQQAWGRSAVVDIARDEIWPALEPDFQQVVACLREVLALHGLSEGAVGQFVVAGSPLSWEAACQALSVEFHCQPCALPFHTAAMGAARLALGSPPDVQPPRPTHAAWSQKYHRLPPRARSQEIRSTSVGEQLPTKEALPAASESEFQLALERVWSYLLGVGSVSPQRATELTKEVLRTAGELLDGFSVLIPNSSQETAVNADIERARRALREGRYQDAIQAAHAAQQTYPDDAGVFRQMIDMHIEAANDCADDEAAIQWLECAHAHDQSDKTIHELLAARCRKHARFLLEQNQLANAVRAIHRALQFDPYDAESQILSEQIYARLKA